ncbi:type I-B CRISPR-associated protein Cas5b [Roseivirga sp. BDSF3-8]|uniref:type I-B CRISPR-associated protein Cas5b n=1 Tax=Roseivirga sp. BDSF3-8 TaxID=3241598 RepID=UPI003532624F
MNSEEVLAFTLRGEYGHFRKFNTTTSPLSYSLPGPTALAGLMGAVLGIEREDSGGKLPGGGEPLREAFSPKRCRWAVQVIHPVKKVYIGFNLINTKAFADYYNLDGRANKGRTQVEFELLKDLAYRIYLQWDHPRRDELAERLSVRRHHFTPYLGLSQFTAELDGEGTEKLKKVSGDDEFEACHSAINLSLLEGEGRLIDFGDEQHYHTDTLPLEMNLQREIGRYGEVLLETHGNPIKVKGAELYRTQTGQHIHFL